MKVKVITEKCQEYLNEKYYLCGKYFQRDGVRLHRKVWEDINGEIPSDCHVHHKDHDRSNNQPSNLECVNGRKHLSEHHTGHKRGVPKEAIKAAAKWHGSPEGLSWHHEHYRKNASRLHVHKNFVCDQCGSSFVAIATGMNRFCSNKCKTKSRNISGVDNVIRSCIECGNSFKINKYVKKQTCSRECSVKVKLKKTA